MKAKTSELIIKDVTAAMRHIAGGGQGETRGNTGNNRYPGSPKD
jgi:hypothetical protein